MDPKYYTNFIVHRAAFEGSVERTLAVLSGGGIDIGQISPAMAGSTPLMIAAHSGYSRLVSF